jgi:hypothetical protein
MQITMVGSQHQLRDDNMVDRHLMRTRELSRFVLPCVLRILIFDLFALQSRMTQLREPDSVAKLFGEVIGRQSQR